MGRHTTGGRVSTTINGVQYSARGEITIDASGISVEAGVNQDGSLYRTVKPKARTVEITFDRNSGLVDGAGRPLKWDETLMLLDNIPVTFVEQDTNIMHLLSNAFFTGQPQHNTATGEVSGLGLAAERYETVNG
jgi:hypothetical protein